MAATLWLRDLKRALTTLPELLNVNTITVGDEWASRFHKPLFYDIPTHELCHVMTGHAQISYARRSFTVAPGDTFIIPRGTMHRDIHATGEEYRVFYVFFQWPDADRLLAGLDPARLVQPPATVKQHLRLMLKELETEYLGENGNAPHHMQIQLLEIVLALTRYAHQAPPAPHQLVARQQRRQLAAAAQQYLQEHHATLITLEALATHLRVSPFHLSRSFSQEFGVAIFEMLTTIRLEHAQELLRQRRLPVKQIAAATGFPDSNYFGKVFRRHFGVSPTEYQAKVARM